MRIEINPRSLLNLENICEVLYKLHPSVLDDLVEMERSLGNILGFIDLNNLSLEEREFCLVIIKKITQVIRLPKMKMKNLKINILMKNMKMLVVFTS